MAKKTNEEPDKTNYDKLCKSLNERKKGMNLCVPLPKAYEFFNKLLNEFPAAELAITLNMPVQDLIKIPRGLKAEKNSFTDLSNETLEFMPIIILGTPKNKSTMINKMLRAEKYSKAYFNFKITSSLGIILLEKDQRKNHIAFFCKDPNESITDESHMRTPRKLLNKIMPILEPYITSYNKIKL